MCSLRTQRLLQYGRLCDSQTLRLPVSLLPTFLICLFRYVRP